MFTFYLFLLICPIHITISAAEQPSCIRGSYLIDGACQLCPKGTYSDSGNATVCTPCPKGTYNEFMGAEVLGICKDCPEGTFQDRLGATSRNSCKRCPPGQNAPEGAPSCISCPANSFISLCKTGFRDIISSLFRGSCYACIASSGGYVECNLEGPTKTKCVDCGLFGTSTKNSLECSRCPSGTYRSAISGTCVSRKCPDGYFLLGYGETPDCRPCNYYEVSDGRKGECERCPPGTQANQEHGATKCEQCPPDTYKDDDYSRQCRKCPPGQISTATGGFHCLPEDFGCPSNYFKDNNGICRTCPFQTRYDEITKNCVPCPKNYISVGGISKKCNPCPGNMISPINVTSINDLQCDCRPGFGFVKGSNGILCERCPEGTSSDGKSSCRQCSKDRFANRKGSTECAPCPPGMIQPRKGSKSCIPLKCDKGLIPSRLGRCVLPASGCPPGYIHEPDQSLPARTFCEPFTCPPGTARMEEFFHRYSIISCSTCFTSERFDPLSSSCKACRENEFSEGGLSTECKKCPATEVYSSRNLGCGCYKARMWKNGRCSSCPKGTRGFEHNEGCITCPAGTYSDKEGGFECKKCPAGTYSSVEGSEKCAHCSPGTRSFLDGNTKCS